MDPNDSNQRRAHASRRLGDDYQDIVGLEALLKLLVNPTNTSAVRFEADQAGALDDVVIQHVAHTEFIQVKYAVDRNQEWSVEDLTMPTRPGGKSLLRKWAAGWRSLVEQYSALEARVETNRIPGEDLNQYLVSDGTELNVRELDDTHPLIASTGLPASDARTFLQSLNFSFGNPMLEARLERIRSDFANLGVTDRGWASLLESMRRWARYIEGDGWLRVGDVRIAAKLWDPMEKPISQDFGSDPRVHVLVQSKIDTLLSLVLESKGQFTTVTGPPGSGKSSLLSALVNTAKNQQQRFHAVIRHHCYLSQDDLEHERRLQSNTAATDLCRQLYQTFASELRQHPDVSKLNLENPGVADLRDWIAICSEIAFDQGKLLLVVLDGLDHVYDERGKEELHVLLRQLPIPAPDGLHCVLGSQNRPNLLPSRLSTVVSHRYKHQGFDENEVRAYASGYLSHSPTSDVVSALCSVSEGNPLYLRYLLAEAESYDAIDSDWVIARPVYGGNIDSYYAALWTELNAVSRVLVIALSEVDFAFPTADVPSLMGAMNHSAAEIDSAMRATQHLVLQSKGGIRIYHSSFRFFLRELDKTKPIRTAALQAIRNWLSECGNDGLRWSYEWSYDLRLGNATPLLSGMTREWVKRSIRELRPIPRLLELMKLACNEALMRDNLALAYVTGSLIWTVQTAADLERDDGALADLRRCALRLRGFKPVARVAMAEGYSWDAPSLCEISRAAALQGDIDLSSDIFRHLQKRLSRDKYIDEQDVAQVYRAGACAGIEQDRIIRHHVANSERGSETINIAWAAYVHELALLRDFFGLSTLTVEDRLSDAERASAADKLAEFYDQARSSDFALKSLRRAAMTSSSNYLAFCLAAHEVGYEFGHPTSPFHHDLDSPPLLHGDRGTWRSRYALTFWRTLRLVVSNNREDLQTYREDLANDGRQRSKAMRTLTNIAEESGALFGDGNFSIDALCDHIDSLSWPVSWKHDEREFRELLDHEWLGLVSQAMVLATKSGNQVTLSLDDIRRLWSTRGGYPPVFSLLVSASTYDWMDGEAVSETVKWIKSKILSWPVSFQERADALAALSVVAAHAGLIDEANLLTELVSSNMLGYGYHKDSTLHSTLDLICTLAEYDLGDPIETLERIAPCVAAVQDCTDGDETRHLPLELFEVLTRVAPDRAPDYLIWMHDAEDWYNLGRCLEHFFETSDMDNPLHRALGRTAGNSAEIQTFASAWRRWINSECSDEQRPSELAALERWESITSCGVDASAAPSHGELEGHSHAESSTRSETFEDLVSTLETVGFSRELRVRADWPLLIRRWFPTSLSTSRANELKRLVELWLENGDQFSCEITDSLWEVCLNNGMRDSAFRLLCMAQAQGHGWFSFWGSPDDSLNRQEAVLGHFSERAEEFVRRSIEAAGIESGIGHPDVVTKFLARADRGDVAADIVERWVDHVIRMFPEYPLQDQQWANSDDPIHGALDLLVSRVSHPSAAIRVSAAQELSRLPNPSRAADCMIRRIEACRDDGECLGEWLALLLLLREAPEAVSSEKIKSACENKGELSLILRREALRLKGDDAESELRPIHSLPGVVRPDWFEEILQRGPLGYRLKRLSDSLSSLVSDGIYAHVKLRGLTRRRIHDLIKADNLYSSLDDSYTPHDNRLYDMLISGLSATAANAGDEMNDASAERVKRMVRGIIPFDLSFARTTIHAPPTWIPDRVRSGGHTSGIQSFSLIDWSRVTKDDQCESRPLALDAQVRHQGASEHTRVLPFLYEWTGVEQPAPEHVYMYLEGTWLSRKGDDLEALLDLPGETFGEAPYFPATCGGLSIFAITGEQRCLARRWHALHGFVGPIRLLPDTPFSGILSMEQLNGDLVFLEAPSADPIAIGRFWQLERHGPIHRELGLSGGFTLDVSQEWLASRLERIGLRLAWVQKTTLSYYDKYGRPKVRQDEVFSFHSLSKVLIP